MKITTRLKEIDSTKEVGFGLEFFCPDSDEGLDDLRPRIDRMASTEPLFVDIVGPGGLEAARRALRVCKYAKKFAGLPAVLHIAVSDLTAEDVKTLLNEAKACGVTNLLVERGVSPPDPNESHTPTYDTALAPIAAARPAFKAVPGGFQTTAELISCIREEFGDAFCVGCLGFPCGWGEYGGSLEADLTGLAAAVDAGAEFVIAQHVNEARTFLDFRDKAASVGVSVPIIPSVMPVQSYDSFIQVNTYCGVPLPPALSAGLDSLRADEAAVREFGNRLVVNLVRDLLSRGDCHAFVISTLNLEVVVRGILADLALCGPGSTSRRRLPWRPSGDEARAAEDVRPIFWANRPASYVERTATWQNFPSGRWSGTGGEQRAFEQLTSEHLVPRSAGSVDERRAMWGEAPLAQADVWEVFARYVEGRVPRLPWCEVALHPETSTISLKLAALNRAGFLTINSQPRVNGCRSDDATFGWGGSGGYVYQKAYIECFMSPANLSALMEVCASASHASITYHAVDATGNTYSNCRTRGVQAVTWGVFPGKEIIQPTVVDPDSFLAWKTEAFALWLSQWAPIYDDDSSSRDLIHEIHDTYYLVNLVDNDFVRGDIFSVFDDALHRLHRAGDPVPAPAPGATQVRSPNQQVPSATFSTGFGFSGIAPAPNSGTEQILSHVPIWPNSATTSHDLRRYAGTTEIR